MESNHAFALKGENGLYVQQEECHIVGLRVTFVKIVCADLYESKEAVENQIDYLESEGYPNLSVVELEINIL